jgi:two-component system, NtrC family, nitrogen regulation sensor histidine kinase GlnL
VAAVSEFVAVSGPAPDPVFPAHILAAMTSPVLVVDEALRLAFVNPAAEQLLALGRNQLQGRSLAEVLTYDSPLIDLIRRVQLHGVGISEYAVSLAGRRGEERVADLHVTPLAEAGGPVLAVLHPCSVARSLDQQLAHRGAARSVASLAATLAHEVKNPLSGIRGAAQLLEGALSDEDRPLVRLICEETDRICALVDRMEQFADGRPLVRRPVNIHRVLEHVRRIAEHGFARHVRFVERYDPSLPAVDGERDGLIQAFLNLVKNAAEATPAGDGEIVLATQYQHGLRIGLPNSRERLELPITVEVADNGQGVPEDIRRHLFEPFVSGKPAGKGLGLPLVAKIVGDHGGVVGFHNLPKGALFRVHLPARLGGAPGEA